MKAKYTIVVPELGRSYFETESRGGKDNDFTAKEQADIFEILKDACLEINKIQEQSELAQKERRLNNQNRANRVEECFKDHWIDKTALSEYINDTVLSCIAKAITASTPGYDNNQPNTEI